MTLDDLRKIAEAATKGPWDYQPWSTYALPSGDYAESILLASAAEDGEIVRGPRDEDGEFIATFNPQKVLEMIDTLRGAEIRLDHAKTVIDRLQARLAAVEKLHSPVEAIAANGDTITVCDHCVGDLAYVFDEQMNWPCDTIKAARGE